MDGWDQSCHVLSLPPIAMRSRKVFDYYCKLLKGSPITSIRGTEREENLFLSILFIFLCTCNLVIYKIIVRYLIIGHGMDYLCNLQLEAVFVKPDHFIFSGCFSTEI